MALPVGLQLYSVRDMLEKDFDGTLRKVREIGYEWAELSGLNGMDPAAVKRSLDAAGLKAISSHVPLSELQADPRNTAERYKAAGCRFLAVPWTAEDQRQSESAWRDYAAGLDALGAEYRSCGITLMYHNHNFEFEKFGGEYLLDILYRTAKPENLSVQLDTCWARFSGADPSGYLLKYAGRCPVVHLKDFHVSGEPTGTPYDLIGRESGKKQASGFEFRPVGFGDQDIPSVLDACGKAQAQFVVVEQDESKAIPTLKAAELSRMYLASLGW